MQQQRRHPPQNLPSDEVPALQEVASADGALKNCKAAAVCGISPEMIKCGGQDGLRMLHVLIVDVYHIGVVLDDWRSALILPLYKKGDPTDMNVYRGISLLSLPGKIFAILLKKRLQTWAEAILMEEQCGFRRGRSCNIPFSAFLKSLCELTNKAGHNIHTCFIDMSKAYHFVDRHSAWELF